jgi:sulfate adenylyltransferase large subunit
MTALPLAKTFEREEALPAESQSTTLLRLVVCGSVDHGKSTLIGRLLFEAGILFDDQLAALDRAQSEGEGRDFSLLLDGLAAEREQKITIDVAYRYFTTARRKFIVADAPGHEQYTRNMASGASNADAALLLVSANEGLTRQTRRHALIASMLGVRHLVVAVNKMDLVGWSQSAFAAVEADFRIFARDLAVDEIVCVPVAAKSGDNIVAGSASLPWYAGPSLLECLERLEVTRGRATAPFRMPVQWVNRPNSDFRGYCGTIASGELHTGAPVQVLPSGQRTHVRRIVTADGDLVHAVAGQAVTLTFADEIDASRGDMLAHVGAPAPVTSRFAARLVWLGEEPLLPRRSYILKLATATANATLAPGIEVIDLDTLRSAHTDRLGRNDIGTVVVELDRAVAVDRYADNRTTGSFVLIDPETYDTVGIGLVEVTHPNEDFGRARGQTALEKLKHVSDTHSRSIAKAIGWRATGSLDTFIVAVVISGSTKVAGGVALAEIVTKTFLYYFHERIWALVPWGKR